MRVIPIKPSAVLPLLPFHLFAAKELTQKAAKAVKANKIKQFVSISQLSVVNIEKSGITGRNIIFINDLLLKKMRWDTAKRVSHRIN